jgi:hypothetical protein
MVHKDKSICCLCWCFCHCCRCPECSNSLTLGALKPVAQQPPAAAAAAAAGAAAGAAAAAAARAHRPAVEQGPFVVCDSKLLKLKEVSRGMRRLTYITLHYITSIYIIFHYRLQSQRSGNPSQGPTITRCIGE